MTRMDPSTRALHGHTTLAFSTAFSLLQLTYRWATHRPHGTHLQLFSRVSSSNPLIVITVTKLKSADILQSSLMCVATSKPMFYTVSSTLLCQCKRPGSYQAWATNHGPMLPQRTIQPREPQVGYQTVSLPYSTWLACEKPSLSTSTCPLFHLLIRQLHCEIQKCKK